MKIRGNYLTNIGSMERHMKKIIFSLFILSYLTCLNAQSVDDVNNFKSMKSEAEKGDV